MSAGISNLEGIKLLSEEFSSRRNVAIAKAVLATAAIVMAVATMYIMGSSIYSGLMTAGFYEMQGAITAAAIIGGATALVTLPGLGVGISQILKAVKDVLSANKLLDIVKQPEENKEAVEVLSRKRESALGKEISNIDQTKTKLLSGTGSLEEIAYGADWKVRHLDDSSYTREKAAEGNNALAHKMLTEVPLHARHSKKAIVIGLIAAVAIPIIALSTGNLYVLCAMAAPVALLAYGGAGQFILHRKWKRLTQLDKYQTYWQDKLPGDRRPQYGPKQYATLKTRFDAFSDLPGALIPVELT